MEIAIVVWLICGVIAATLIPVYALKPGALVALLALLFAGCGTGFAVLVHPQTGRTVECREDLFDGITDTIGRCVAAYEQAGYELKGRR